MNAVVKSNNIANFGLILRKREQRWSAITKLLASGSESRVSTESTLLQKYLSCIYSQHGRLDMMRKSIN